MHPNPSEAPEKRCAALLGGPFSGVTAFRLKFCGIRRRRAGCWRNLPLQMPGRRKGARLPSACGWQRIQAGGWSMKMPPRGRNLRADDSSRSRCRWLAASNLRHGAAAGTVYRRRG